MGKQHSTRRPLTAIAMRACTRGVCIVETCVMSRAGGKLEDGASCCYSHRTDAVCGIWSSIFALTYDRNLFVNAHHFQEGIKTLPIFMHSLYWR